MDAESSKAAVDCYEGLSTEQLIQLVTARDKQIQEQEEVIQEKEEVIQEQEEVIQRDSVKRMLQSGLPNMIVNPNCPPSIVANKDAISWTLLRRQKNNESPPKCHDVACIEREDIDSDLFDFEPSYFYENGELIKSELYPKYIHNRKRKLNHDNETSPQDYVGLLLGDVIRCCGIDARVIKEATVFSLRPDLVVVEYHGRILLAVEIKNPGTRGDKTNGLSTFDALETAGLVFDYLKGLQQYYGNDSPIVVLSNYREMVICYLTKDKERVMKHIEKAGRTKPTRVARSEAVPSPEKPNVSPEKPEGFFIPLLRIDTNTDETLGMEEEKKEEEPPLNGARVEQGGNEDRNDGTFDYQGRLVTYSQIFKLDKAFQALTLAVKAAALSIQGTPLDFQVPHHDCTLKKELCALGQNWFGWKKFNVTIRYDKRPKLGQNFSVGVLASIGRGSTGKCLLCCTTTGITFVAKLFLPEVSFRYSDPERKEEMDKSLETKLKAANDECSLWTTLLNKYAKFCFVSELNGIPALIMPYFAPLRKQERRDSLPQVEALLEQYAESGYAYLESDVRWSHVGRRGMVPEDEELVLLDLGSLSHVGKDEAKGKVADAVTSLQDWMDVEEVSHPAAPPLVSMNGNLA